MDIEICKTCLGYDPGNQMWTEHCNVYDHDIKFINFNECPCYANNSKKAKANYSKKVRGLIKK